MKNRILILLILFSLSDIYGQSSDKIYLSHNHNYSTTYSYAITQITIHSDATYTWKNWDVTSKKDWKSYKKYKPQIDAGKITKNGEFYTFTDYRNGEKTDIIWTMKIFDKRLLLYHLGKNGKYKKIAKYKRIE